MYDNNTLTNRCHSVVGRDIELFDARQCNSKQWNNEIFDSDTVDFESLTFDSDSSTFDVSDRRMV